MRLSLPRRQAWDLAVDICLSQLPTIMEEGTAFRVSGGSLSVVKELRVCSDLSRTIALCRRLVKVGKDDKTPLWVCVCVCVCVYMRACVFAHVYIHVCAKLCTFLCVCAHAYLRVCVRTCVHLCVCICVLVYMCTCVCLCTSVCTCVRVYTCTCVRVWLVCSQWTINPNQLLSNVCVEFQPCWL
jgi:hypothetical protein